jgi:hypothetical protein
MTVIEGVVHELTPLPILSAAWDSFAAMARHYSGVFSCAMNDRARSRTLRVVLRAVSTASKQAPPPHFVDCRQLLQL